MPEFSHLHVHTQYSLLDGAADIKKLLAKAADDKMKAVAITDHGNMFGVFSFVAEAAKHNIKPIVGCEFYVVQDRHKKQFTKEKRDKRYHQLLLAKNAEGYKNLVKLCSLGYIDGLYGKYPRIDKELILQYHKGLIATTCCIGAEVPQLILHEGEEAGEKAFRWWLDIFGEDYYIELQRHNMTDQDKVNQVLIKFSAKYNVKAICSNDSHYIDEQDSNAHDILLCVNTGDMQATPIANLEEGGKGYRFGFPNNQFFFKTQAQMGKLFADIPQALDNTNEIVDKVEQLRLKQDIMLPNFIIPAEFTDQDAYLRHLSFEGARKRYSELTIEVQERLDFELFTIKSMGFAGYFLIVADFIKAGRELGVYVGPGRGSAAGSAVAYCIGITNIDPLKYKLLFERFLNPDRKSMPDIDTDFDDEGRAKVIDYVVKKYGRNQVAQIVTFGTMAAKSSIKDVARVLDLPLSEANILAKLVPDRPGTSLNRVMFAPLDGPKSLKEKEALNPDEFDQVKKLREFLAGSDLKAQVLREAVKLEGSVRNTGIHAAGIIIAPKDLTEIIPVATSKESELLITQFEGSIIEDSGVIKMDFLGLKNLTIIRDALVLIKQRFKIELELDDLPLDDLKTLELFQKGETNGTFQFESAGMQANLIRLKPDKFEDLIAMNALYRPGPIAYIPDYIERKHGRQAVIYDLPEMQEILEETYGITVYQEQVMLLSQKLGQFTKGDADTLRKAMGKKQKDILDKMKSKFMEGTAKNGHPAVTCEKIWTDWEAFAQYAFNKSHSTCYALVAYQTAYLKAHYPAQYMAALLTNNQNQIDKVTFFMQECKGMGLPVLGPDINDSEYRFSVNAAGEIRFGLGAIKGVGEKAVESIIEERNAAGNFDTIHDFMRRNNLRTVNKRTIETLVQSGAMDQFNGITRGQYFSSYAGELTNGIERLIKYGSDYQASQNSSQQSLFAGTVMADIAEPALPQIDLWSVTDKLKFEKEVIGFYVSGHPLDVYRLEMENFCDTQLATLDDGRTRSWIIGGIISSCQHRIAKSGKSFGVFTLEDFTGSREFTLFNENYLRFKHFLEVGQMLHVKGKSTSRYKGAEVEPSIEQIQLLSGLREKMAKAVIVHVNIDLLSTAWITGIENILKQYPGNCEVKFKVLDPEKNIILDFYSKSLRVDPGNELFSALNAYPSSAVGLL